MSVFDKFLSLDETKRESILNAAYTEFSRKGYEAASTNEIVKDAGISKGLLFHYFGSKEKLFLFLYDYALELLGSEYYTKLFNVQGDIFHLIKQGVLFKSKLMEKYPRLFDFITTANLKDSGRLKADVERRNQGFLGTFYAKLKECVKASDFRDDIDAGKAADIIIWTMEGCSNRMREAYGAPSSTPADYDFILSVLDGYFDILKKTLYKWE